jgi:hypothetical protein
MLTTFFVSDLARIFAVLSGLPTSVRSSRPPPRHASNFDSSTRHRSSLASEPCRGLGLGLPNGLDALQPNAADRSFFALPQQGQQPLQFLVEMRLDPGDVLEIYRRPLARMPATTLAPMIRCS